MTNSIEMALRLFSPKGALHEPSSGRSSTLGREEFLGALQVAAKSNQQGLQSSWLTTWGMSKPLRRC